MAFPAPTASLQLRPALPRRRAWLRWMPWLAAALACWPLVRPSVADDAKPRQFSAAEFQFFETSVRPLLAKHCFECHGPGKQESGLRLDSRTALMAGGDNGPVVIAGDPANSRLVRAIAHSGQLRMPPSGKLGDEAVAALTRWVKLGVPWPESTPALRSAAAQGASGFRITPEDRAFWSFRPVAQPQPPAVRDRAWPRDDVDRFVLARLEAAGLHPSPPADRHALLRRVTFDLIGLPPTPEEVQAFVQDESADAFAKVVDRLLASPHYGERQARHWLDVARYGEDQAHTFQARQYPQGYRYRDWLVQAFNDDLPYDEFARQQIAGDLLGDGDKLARLPALGFFACGPVYYGDRQQLDQISDRIDTLTRGFLGLTVACARCHDHKYDPISTADYYALAGVFASTDYVEAPLVPPDEVAAAEKALTADERKKKVRPKYPFAHAVKDAASPRNLRVHVRGNADNLGAETPRRFLEILCRGNPAPFQQGSGRLELAQSIASADNPLTARVMVNRVWQHHFGKGLVRTASNFGLLGERPTHPELLDYLAARFVKSGWSLKALHREIVLSATYQQSSRFDERSVGGDQPSVGGDSRRRTEPPLRRQESAPTSERANEVDPENRLLWRMNRRRLEVEAWRDAMLTSAGRLDPAMGGLPGDLALADQRRRTLYGFVSRHELNPLLRLFDFPDPNVTAEQRPETTVPLQQLFVLNSEFMVQNARALAQRLQTMAGDDPARVRRAIEMLYSRPASEQEVAIAIEYLNRATIGRGSANQANSERLTRWERLAQAFLASNEFMYID